MLIIIHGENCSDDCPFYNFDVYVDHGARIKNPTCRLSGHEYAEGKVLDIRLRMRGKVGVDRYCPRPKECPFSDPHGQTVEVSCVS